MWEIRKVCVAQIRDYGDGAVAYVGENEQRAADIVKRARADMGPDMIGCGNPPRSPRVETWMAAVRFDGEVAVEVQGLAKCRPAEFGDPFSQAEIDIARGGGEVAC